MRGVPNSLRGASGGARRSYASRDRNRGTQGCGASRVSDRAHRQRAPRNEELGRLPSRNTEQGRERRRDQSRARRITQRRPRPRVTFETHNDHEAGPSNPPPGPSRTEPRRINVRMADGTRVANGRVQRTRRQSVRLRDYVLE